MEHGDKHQSLYDPLRLRVWNKHRGRVDSDRLGLSFFGKVTSVFYDFFVVGCGWGFSPGQTMNENE